MFSRSCFNRIRTLEAFVKNLRGDFNFPHRLNNAKTKTPKGAVLYTIYCPRDTHEVIYLPPSNP